MRDDKSPAFQFYVNDFLGSGKVGTMTMEEVGVYTFLLCLDWNENGFAHDEEELARWCRMPRDTFAAAWRRVSRAFDLDADGRYRNARLKAEREKQARYRAAMSANGTRGGRPPKQPADTGGEKPRLSDGFSDTKAKPIESTPLPSPTPVTATTLGASDDAPVVAPAPKYPPAFDAAWSAYPKRDGSNSKADAYTQWARRVGDGVPEAVLHAGVVRYAAWAAARGHVGTRVVMQAARFFGKGEHWADPAWEAPPPLAVVSPAGPSLADLLAALATQYGLTSYDGNGEAYGRRMAEALADSRVTDPAAIRRAFVQVQVHTLGEIDRRWLPREIAQRLAGSVAA